MKRKGGESLCITRTTQSMKEGNRYNNNPGFPQSGLFHMEQSEVEKVKRDNRLSYKVGFVSFFYWLFVYIYPTERLISPDGIPLNGIGLIINNFSDVFVSLFVMTVSSLYLVAIYASKEKLRIVMAGILFGVWVTSTSAMVWWAFMRGLVSPSLAIYAGYCVSIFIDIRTGDDNKWIGKK